MDHSKAGRNKRWLNTIIYSFKKAVNHPTELSFERANRVADALRMLAISDDMLGTQSAAKLNQAATLIDGKH